MYPSDDGRSGSQHGQGYSQQQQQQHQQHQMHPPALQPQMQQHSQQQQQQQLHQMPLHHQFGSQSLPPPVHLMMPTMASQPLHHHQAIPSTSNTSMGSYRSSSSSMGSTSQQQKAAQQQVMMSSDLDHLIKTLQDQSQRDDLKLRALQDIWNGFDAFSCSPTYAQLLESLMRCFLKLFTETAAQFIQENNTQQLRRLMLEIILRTSGHEVMKAYSKNIQQHMMKIVQTDNEVNAVLAVKILVDHIKLHRMPFTSDIGTLITHLRTVYRDMIHHVLIGRMFDTRNFGRSPGMIAEDLVIETSLQHCFVQQQVNLDSGKHGGGAPLMYQLIPRSSQSVKVLGEVPMMTVLLAQVHKTQIQNELIEFGQQLLQFINVRVPSEQLSSQLCNKELVADFHNAQVKALSFFVYMIRSQAHLMPVVEAYLSNGQLIVSGVLLMLETCPNLIVNQRKELLASTKQLFSCEQIRGKFLPVLPRLFSEKLMIGSGFTANDGMRTQMYTQLADLIHHLRSQLSYPLICHATFVYSRCLHDNQLPPTTQSMSIRLIMNLSDSFLRAEQQSEAPCRDILLQVLETVVAKLRVIVIYHLPALFQTYGEGQIFRSCEFRESEMREEDAKRLCDVIAEERKKEGSGNTSRQVIDDLVRLCSIECVPELEQRANSDIPPMPEPTIKDTKGYTPPDGLLAATWAAAGPPMPLSECRSMIRFLLNTSKYLIQSISNSRKTDRSLTPAEERDIFVRFFKYGLQALDVISLNPGVVMMQHAGRQGSMRDVVSRESKEMVEFFVNVMSALHHEVFNEIFTNYIDFLIERIAHNSLLISICNQLLVNNDSSSRFGCVLVNYLLKRMPDLAMTSDRSSLYLKMFKLIFSAISCAYKDGVLDIERMLRPHLHEMVRKATTLALRARDPNNYFLLLRALFRSIGGGAHDVLYQQFLPLLPALLSQLNRLQSGVHRQHMRELFVELCLTVPVRLSSLLPYLPLLMEPLVCALNGSPTLVQQGLRTLELCVDNLQPDYLYEHMAPVRAALLQGLWRTLGTATYDSAVAVTALRLLGKFGGSNRRMLCEPQPLAYLDASEVEEMVVEIELDRVVELPSGTDETFESPAAASTPTASNTADVLGAVQLDPLQQSAEQLRAVKMEICEDQQQQSQIPSSARQERVPPLKAQLPLSTLVKAAVEQFRMTTGPDVPNPQSAISINLRAHAAELCRKILLAGLAAEDFCDNEEAVIRVRLRIELLRKQPLPDTPVSSSMYRCPNEAARQVYVNALTVLAFAVSGTEMRQSCMKFFNSIVKQLTLQALLEQTYAATLSSLENSKRCMDGTIVVDVLEATLTDSGKSFINTAVLMLRLIAETCLTVVGDDVEMFARLPLLSHLLARLSALCNGAAWFERLGGATAFAFIIDEYPRQLVRNHLELFIRALLEAPLGLSSEVSSGAVDKAVMALESLPAAVFGTTSQVRAVLKVGGPKEGPSDAASIAEEAQKEMTAVFVDAYAPLLLNDDPFLHGMIARLLTSLAETLSRPLKELLDASPINSLLASALLSFPALSLWRQIATMHTLSFVLEAGCSLEEMPEKDLSTVCGIVMRQIARLCEDNDEKLLARKQYQQVGACSHTIPHAACASDLRNQAMRTYCVCYTLVNLPGVVKEEEDKESARGLPELGGERLLRIGLGIAASEDLRLRKTTGEALLKANQQRPLENAVIEAELSRVLDEIETNRDLPAPLARRLCLLLRLRGSLFSRRCFDALMSVLRAWDERTRRSSAELRERSGDEVDALESVLVMLPSLERTQSTTAAGTEAAESSSSQGREKEEIEAAIGDFPMDGTASGSPQAPPIMTSSSQGADPADLVPIICSLVATMHAAYCIPRNVFLGSSELIRFLVANPVRTLRFFLSADSLHVPARRSLFKRIFEREEAAPLRNEAFTAPGLFQNMLRLQFLSRYVALSTWSEMEFARPLSPSDERASDYEFFTIWIIDQWSRNDHETYARADDVIRQITEIWRSDDFKTRYMVKTDDGQDDQPIKVQVLNSVKYEVPKLFANCLVRYMRLNYTNLDIFFDLLFVFLGSFATDFCFVRNYLRDEVIPTYPLKWRRALLEKIFDRFENHLAETVCDLRIVRILQYAATPCLQYAFERYDVEEVVGPHPDSQETESGDQNNLVVRLAQIIQITSKQLSDAMIVAMYQLATLVVQYAHTHIHVNKADTTRQSNRLRTFMLFAWPCLSIVTQDLTLKYSGHLFLAHIIERFSINRKIVLQVYHSLTQAHQQDSRDIIKKAVDILTPAVPNRMDDGLMELFKVVKKALTDESHNLHSIFHCLQMVTRNYRVYFPLRHDLLPLLIGGITRLTAYQVSAGYSDSRRLAVEVCEMVIKWELLRIERLNRTKEEADAAVERILETLKRGDKEQSSGESVVGSPRRQSIQQPSSSQESKGCAPDEADVRPISREHADNVVNTLLKIATTLPPLAPPAHQQATIELNKRSIGLLRASLKPVIWGETALIKFSWLEKHLTIPPEYSTGFRAGGANSQEQMQIQQSLMQAQQTVEVLVALVFIMPPALVVQTIRPLQKAISTCLMTSVPTVNLPRSVINLVSRLLERTAASPSGLDDFEILNQFIVKFINDHFAAYEKHSNPTISTVYTAFSMLRTICIHQPAFVDTMCFQGLLKVMMRAAKEYHGTVNDATRDKVHGGVCDVMTIALDMLRPRLSFLSSDHKRSLASNVLTLFADAGDHKLQEALIRCTHELIVTHNDEATANPGLTVAVKLYPAIRGRHRQHGQLVRAYLQMVLHIFESPSLRATDFASKLEDAFYWGLTCSDDVVRNAFLSVWEASVSASCGGVRSLFGRLSFIFAQQDWSLMRDTLWIKHALALILHCGTTIRGESREQPRMNIRGAATFGATRSELLKGGGGEGSREGRENTEKREIQRQAEGRQQQDETLETMRQDGTAEEKEEDKSPEQRLDDLLSEQSFTLSEASSFDLAFAIDNILGLVFLLQDANAASSIFYHLFSSIWSALTEAERTELQTLFPLFLSSYTHCTQASLPAPPPSSISIILDAFSRCTPKVVLHPSLVKYLSSRHRAWFRGVGLLEEEVASIPSMRGLHKLLAAPSPEAQLQIDVLDYLSMLYSELGEADQQAVVWRRRALFRDTPRALSLTLKGDWERASLLLDNMMAEHSQRLENAKRAAEGGDADNTPALHELVNLNVETETEYWLKQWTECSAQLGRWTELVEVANSKPFQDARLLCRVLPHTAEPFSMLRACREQVAACLPPDFTQQFYLTTLYLAALDGNGETHDEYKAPFNRAFEECVASLIQRWRTLPTVVGGGHVRVLQMIQETQEISEAASLIIGLLPQPPHPSGSSQQNNSFLSDMKGVVKTWRNRLPAVLDDQATVTNIYSTRKRLLMRLVRTFDDLLVKGPMTLGSAAAAAMLSNQNYSPFMTMLLQQLQHGGNQAIPAHAAAQAQLSLARSARHGRFYDLSAHLLNLLHSEPSLPLMDMHQKTMEQLKLHRAIAADPRTEAARRVDVLREALQVTEEMNVNDLIKDQFSRLYAARGLVLSELGMSKDASTACKIAAQLAESGSAATAFAAWAKHLDSRFHADRTAEKAETVGVDAILCFIEAARTDTESHARKYISRAIWTSRHLAQASSQVAQTVPGVLEKHARGCLPTHWISWLPQLCLDLRNGIGLLGGFVSAVARAYPLHAFYALRQVTGCEERMKVINDICRLETTNSVEGDDAESPFFKTSILTIFPKLTVIIEVACTKRPSDIFALEQLLSAVDEAKEFWAERQLRFALRLQSVVFEDLRNSMSASPLLTETVKQAALEWKEELLKTGGKYEIGQKNSLIIWEAELNDGERREDEFITSLKNEVLPQLGATSMTLLGFSAMLIRWRSLLEKRIASLPKQLPLRLTSSTLSSFCDRSASVDMFSELFAVRSGQYMAMISRFLPHFEVSVRGGRVTRRLSVRAQTGKVVYYIVRREFGEQRESRVNQCMHFINGIMHKERMTSCRFLSLLPPCIIHAGCTQLVEHSGRTVNSSVFLEEVLSNSLALLTPPLGPDSLVHLFEEKLAAARGADVTGDGYQARIRAYNEVTAETPVRPTLLLEMLSRRLPDPTMFYALRKTMASDLAVLSALEFALHFTPLGMGSFHLNISTGKLANSEYRIITQPCSSDERPVLFRLTPNLQTLFGLSLEGHFSWSLCAVLRLFWLRPALLPLLRPLIWDSVLAEDPTANLAEVNRRSEAAMEQITERIRVSNTEVKDEDEAIAFQLVRQALEPANLCKMPPTWQPWF